ncbi:hypothetical protein ACF049_07370 [Cellulosimicrobium funkei]|uniref:hypothetical protein n=1 Tax=Cellulosimicrobium funkei TaxID=264251 RepID=UPI0036F93F67
MAVRFVPPPGWPVPAGFTPTTEWHPDPSWPPPPPGWVFWADDAAPAPRPVPPPEAPVLRSTEPLPVGSGAPTRRSLRARSSGATPAVGPEADATRVAAAVPAAPPIPGAVEDHPVASSTMILPALGGMLDDPAARPSPGPAARPATPAPAARPTPSATPGAAPTVPARAGRSGVVPVGPLALPAADDDGDHAPERGRRWLVPTAVGLAGVAVGLLVGIGLTLSAQGEAQRERAEAQRVQSEVAAEREQLESERADLDAQRAELDAATAQLTEREEAVAQAEEDASKRSQELDDRQKEQDEREQEERPGNGPGNGGGNGNDGGDGDGGGGGWDWGDWGW